MKFTETVEWQQYLGKLKARLRRAETAAEKARIESLIRSAWINGSDYSPPLRPWLDANG